MKKTRPMNYRLTYYPEDNQWNSDEEALDLKDLKSLRAEIFEHIPTSRSQGKHDGGNIEYDTYDYCEFCNRKWDVDDDGCPGCCNKAMEEWNAEHGLANEVKNDG